MTPTRFVIAGTPRSGSNWLASALNSHPGVVCEGELLDDPFLAEHPRFAADPWSGIEVRRREAGRTGKAWGFKLFYFHCWDYHTEHRVVWDRLAADTGIRVILLTRTNLLALAASWTRARLTGQWTLTGDAIAPPVPAVHLDPAGLLKTFEAIEAGVLRIERTFAGHHTLRLTYETLFDDPDRRLGQVQDVLGLDRMPIRSGLRRQTSGPVTGSITNAEELARAFADTKYAAFFPAESPALG